jgi:hypothetical protein
MSEGASVQRRASTERAIMDQTRHQSLKQVRKYIRRGSLLRTTPPPGAGCERRVIRRF